MVSRLHVHEMKMAAPTVPSNVLILLVAGVAVCLLMLMLRLIFLKNALGKVKIKGKKTFKTLIVAGSGGHTSEIMRLLSGLSNAYTPRVYVLANTDNISEDKIKRFEGGKATEGRNSEFVIQRIPRSREVRQSYFTSILTTIYATFFAFLIVFKHAPDLVLVNGPGTCIPLCAAAFVMRLLGMKPVIQVYVESICRVEHLSVSGLIMYYLADHLVVQWPALKEKYPKATYLGRIV